MDHAPYNEHHRQPLSEDVMHLYLCSAIARPPMLCRERAAVHAALAWSLRKRRPNIEGRGTARRGMARALETEQEVEVTGGGRPGGGPSGGGPEH